MAVHDRDGPIDALIGVSEVTKRYQGDGWPAVDRVSLTVAAGEAGPGLGPSGRGEAPPLHLIPRPGPARRDRITPGGRAVRTPKETADAPLPPAPGRMNLPLLQPPRGLTWLT